MAKGNPIIETYKGVNIKKYNVCQLRISAPMFKFLILESERTGFPISKILIYSSTPCQACTKTDVIAYDKNDEVVNIKRGIMSRMNPETKGRSIMDHANEKNKPKP